MLAHYHVIGDKFAHAIHFDDLVTRLRKVRDDMALKEKELEDLRTVERELEERQIPDLMLVEMGMEEALTTRGVRIKIKKEVRASLPKDPERRAAMFNYLVESGNGALIKDKFNIEFGRAEHKRADAFEQFLETLPEPVPYERKMDLHHQTMLSFVREKLAKGEAIDLDLFSAFEQRIAKIVEKK